MPVVIAIAFFVALAGGIWLSDYAVRRRVLKRMQHRVPRTPEAFGQALFPPEQADIAAKIRTILARHLNVDLSRLGPEETFGELEIVELNSLASVEFVVDLEKEFGVEISDADAERMQTFGDVVAYVSMKLSEQRTSIDGD